MQQARRINPDQPAVRVGIFRFIQGLLQETGFWLLAVVALGLLAALATFNPDDPAWTHTAHVARIHNIGGAVGAWFADVALYFLGYPAWLVPIGILWGGWRLFKRGALQVLDAEIVLFRVLGFVVILTTACGLAAVHLTVTPGTVPGTGSAGGLLGVDVSHFLINAFGFMGANALMTALLLAGITLGTGFSWLDLLEWVGGAVIKSVQWIGGLGQWIRHPKLPKLPTFPTLVKPRSKADPAEAPDSPPVTAAAHKERPDAPSAPDSGLGTDSAGSVKSLISGWLSRYNPLTSENQLGAAEASAPVAATATTTDTGSNSLVPRVRGWIDAAAKPLLSRWLARDSLRQSLGDDPASADSGPAPTTVAVVTPVAPVLPANPFASEASAPPPVPALVPAPADPVNPFASVVPSAPAAPPVAAALPVNPFAAVGPTPPASGGRYSTRIEPVFNLPPDRGRPAGAPMPQAVAPDRAMPALSKAALLDMTLTPTLTGFPAIAAHPPASMVPAPVTSVAPASPIQQAVPTHPVATSPAPTVPWMHNELTTEVADWPSPDELATEMDNWPSPLPPRVPAPAPLPVAVTPRTLMVEPKVAKVPDRVMPLVSNTGALPSLDLLDQPPERTAGYSSKMLEEMSRQVETRLKSFGIEAKVVAVEPGPVITRFEVDPAPGVKVSQISNLAKDLARGLSVISVRVVEVIPGKSVIGLEIPNQQRETVYLREVLEAPIYAQSTSPLTLALGMDIGGNPVVANLAKMPHLLVAGTTGSGKSVAINAMLLSLLYKASPAEARLILVDPKMLELSMYEDIPHLLTPVVTDMKEAANALRWCVAEMERRYRLMAALKVRNIAGFNRKVLDALEADEGLEDPFWKPEGVGTSDTAPLLQPLPCIVVVIDELADMMMIVGKKVEELIARLAQKARAAGIHLILATQRPSVDVITGLIKANIPTRIAFQVSAKVDSRTILDQMGAESLLGHGDMLYLPPGTGLPQRVHGAFVDDREVSRVVDYLRQTGAPDYIDDVLAESREESEGGGESESAGRGGESDPFYDDAVRIVTESRRASVSGVQRRLRIGYNRAARLVEEMEAAGVVGPLQSNGSREVLAPPPP